MPPASWAQAEQQEQRKKLANSYSELLDEFSSKELHTVGNYSVGRLIGKGSFGKVYLATHKLTNGSKVVLKSAKKDDSNLAREIHHHRQFTHPHIARLYEVIVTESLVWLVLEYCPGDELYHYLLQHGRMEESKVQKIFTQLLGAVSYVHAKGCVHRDLKLENILLDKHENVKLVDFGFTREYTGSTSYLQTWCGTVCYSAPEMLKGEKYAGEKVDVWSLGIILYALLCGELPYDEDDETATKALILKEDPKYPDYMPEGAKDLISKLLSKRPLLRPSLADIMRHPWLVDHAPLQQEILKLQQPPPFSTDLEKSTLLRMRSAGVNIDTVIENVLSQRCDGLAGWWALLMEKEERKEKRREKKRRSSEARSLRRLSAASSRMLATPSLREVDEENQTTLLVGAGITSRGRNASRSIGSSMAPDLPSLAEHKTPTPVDSVAPLPAKMVHARSTSSTGRKPLPLSKDPPRRPRNTSRHSTTMLQVVRTDPTLLAPPPMHQKRRSKPFKEQLATIKTWFKESAKRNKSPTSSKKSSNLADYDSSQHFSATTSDLHRTSTGHLIDLRKPGQHGRPEMQSRATFPARPRISTASSTGSGHSGLSQANRASPAPLTPRSSYRHPSTTGLRGRKSTSSSVSSVRSIHAHRPSHSKASSTSSASIGSPSHLSDPARATHAAQTRSPHASVKVLPGTPTIAGATLPAGIRVNRRPPPGSLGSLPTFADAQARGPGGLGPVSPGVHAVFAKRKRTPFKGPSGLHLGVSGGGISPRGRSAGSAEGSRSGSRQGRRSGDMMIAEEDEDEDGFEEVEAFSPIEPGEGIGIFVEEHFD